MLNMQVWKSLPAILALVLCVQAAALSQSKQSTSIPDLSTLKDELKSQTRPAELRASIPMDAPLNAAEYPVGPGDELSLNIWASSPVEHRLVVTPEGTLLIPTVGRVEVGDATLDSVKAKVVRLIGKKYIKADVSLTLLTPRKVVVQIGGYILNEGRKEVYATQRVNDLIAMSSTFPTEKLTADEYAAQLRRLVNDASDRRIVLKRRGGLSVHVDLAMYRATGKGKYNPYLKEGDVVFIPQRTNQDVQIGVYGAVMNKANFEFVPGDSLSGLIAMALGFRENTDPGHAILTRLSADEGRMDSLRVDARAIAQGQEPDVALRPGDRLIIPLNPETRLDFRASIQGEIVRPGDYPITRYATRLTDLIREAGGLTPLANLHGATILRLRTGATRPAEGIQAEDLLNRRAALIAQDTAYYSAETALRGLGEFVSVDFVKLLVHGDSSQNIVLHPFDQVEIPALSRTVYVFGQVVHPGHVGLVEGKEISFYVDQTGGFTTEARKGDVKVIKAGTRVWLDPSETHVEDGDFIWVPKDPQYPFSYYMTIYAQVAAIVGTIATVALLVRSF